MSTTLQNQAAKIMSKAQEVADNQVKREKRQVSVSRTENFVLVGFSWLEWTGDTCVGVKHTFFDYPADMELASVKQALGKFLHGDETLFFNSQLRMAISSYLDDMAYLFDLVADSEEPAQTFVSRYIL